MFLAQNVIVPEQALFENVPALGKLEAAVIQQGTVANIQWELREKDGTPIDLTHIFPGTDAAHAEASLGHHVETVSTCLEYYLEVIITQDTECSDPRFTVNAEVYNAKEGQIRFTVPLQVSDLGGLFSLNVCLCRKLDRRPVYIQRGLLDVERSSWHTAHQCKMPTLSEIRMKIMDTPGENLLNNYTEFTAADILDSAFSAVKQWNAAPPDLANHRHNCQTFPWSEPWMWKIIAELYTRAALRYMRSKLEINHGGIQGDDLAKDNDYLAIARMYEDKWQNWLTIKKAEVNRNQFYGTAHSEYQSIRNDSGYRY